MSGRANGFQPFPAAAPHVTAKRLLRRQPHSAAPPYGRVTSRRYSRPICGGNRWRRPACSVRCTRPPALCSAPYSICAISMQSLSCVPQKDAPLRFFSPAHGKPLRSPSQAAVSTGIAAPACRRKARYTAACAAAYHSRRKSPPKPAAHSPHPAQYAPRPLFACNFSPSYSQRNRPVQSTTEDCTVSTCAPARSSGAQSRRAIPAFCPLPCTASTNVPAARPRHENRILPARRASS